MQTTKTYIILQTNELWVYYSLLYLFLGQSYSVKYFAYCQTFILITRLAKKLSQANRKFTGKIFIFRNTPTVIKTKDKLTFSVGHNVKPFVFIHRYASNTNAITILSLILRFIFAFACVYRIGFGLFAEPSSKRFVSDDSFFRFLSFLLSRSCLSRAAKINSARWYDGT